MDILHFNNELLPNITQKLDVSGRKLPNVVLEPTYDIRKSLNIKQQTRRLITNLIIPIYQILKSYTIRH